jgi:ferredoxin-NADP reductase/Na+-translocating ferredoxin:NAD+ oxidoreductase RnfD subunit
MKSPLRILDKYLNVITMYKLVMYGLGVLLAGAIILSFTHRLSLSGPAIAASVSVLLITCYIANRALAVLWGAASNTESWIISALILCCILPPSTSLHGLALIALGGLLAMASKYVVAYRHKHLFNPAAFAAVVLGLSGLLPAVWWVGSPSMLIFTAIFGILILRKLRRFQLFLSFLVAALLVAVVVGHMHSQALGYILSTAFKSGPLVFLGTVMLTEPATTPPKIWQQRIYGVLVGAIFMSQLRYGSVSATPELALILGNVYAFIVSPKYKLRLRFKAKRQLAPQIYEFSFSSDRPVDFKPGQYLEWTLPHSHVDSRGNRRTFSIASAQDENELRVAIKASEPGSSFKNALLALQPGDPITTGLLAGNFVMPDDITQPLVFVAGGIGITPFLSMVKTMIKNQERRNIVLFYLVSNQAEYCYEALWKQAESVGVRVVPVLTRGEPNKSWYGLSGRLTREMLQKEVPAFTKRRYYLSGPSGLVDNYAILLRGLGVQAIVTDHFSGY